MPFVYRLSFEKDPPTLTLKMHPECAERAKKLPEKPPFIEDLEKEFSKFGMFCTDFSKNFGFEGACENKGIVDGLLTLSFAIPSCFSLSDTEKCTYCNGTGKSEFGLGDCIWCRETGKKKITSYSKLYATAATLQAAFKYLWYFAFDKKNPLPDLGMGFQLAFVGTYVNLTADMHGASLDGWCHNLFLESCKILNRLQRKYASVENGMYAAYKQIENLKLTPNWRARRESDFRLFLGEKGSFHLQVPGVNDCSFYNTGSFGLKNEITCHNVDNADQQLYLLVGFAILWDIATKSF